MSTRITFASGATLEVAEQLAKANEQLFAGRGVRLESREGGEPVYVNPAVVAYIEQGTSRLE
jgi:hypothetical protein